MQLITCILVCSYLVALGTAAVISFQMPCPIFDCMYLECPSKQYTQNYAMIGGHKCPTCRSCVDTTATAAQDFPILIQMPCPIFDCMYLECPSKQYKQNYAMIGGHKCPTCRSCVDTTSTAAQDISVIQMSCPLFHCMYVECPSKQYTQNYAMFGGRKCPTCRTCVDTTITEAQDFPLLHVTPRCPMFRCAVQQCPNGHYEQSYIEINGHNCSHCPVCVPDSQFILDDVDMELEVPITNRFEDSGSHGCPSAICMTTDKCDDSERFYSFFRYHGQTCEACPYCPKDDELLLLEFEKF